MHERNGRSGRHWLCGSSLHATFSSEVLGLYVHNDVMQALGSPEKQLALLPVFAEWLQLAHGSHIQVGRITSAKDFGWVPIAFSTQLGLSYPYIPESLCLADRFRDFRQ